VGPRTVLNRCGKYPHRDSIPGLSSPWEVAVLTKLYGSTVIYTLYLMYHTRSRVVNNITHKKTKYNKRSVSKIRKDSRSVSIKR